MLNRFRKFAFGFTVLAAVVLAIGCSGSHQAPLAPGSQQEVVGKNQGDTIPLVVKDEANVATKPITGKTVDIHMAKVIVRLLQNGKPVSGVVAHEVSFSRAISGVSRNFATVGSIDPSVGVTEMFIKDSNQPFPNGVGGYYEVKVVYLADRNLEYHWGSVPIRSGQVHRLDVEIGGQATLSYTGEYIYLEDETTPVQVNLRIEGKDRVIYDAQVMGRTALDVVVNAAANSNFTYHILDTQYGPYLDAIGNDVATGLLGWSFVVNNTLPKVGAGDYILKAGDKVLWYYSNITEPGGVFIVRPVSASEQVPSKIVLAGFSDVELFKFKLAAGFEDVDVSRFIVSYQAVAEAYGAAIDNGKPFTSLYNFKLYDGSVLVSGPKSFNITSQSKKEGYIDFNLGGANAFRVSAGTEKVFTLKAVVNSTQSISSGSTHRFSLRPDPYLDGDTRVKAITARGVTTALNLDGPEPGVQVVGNEITVRDVYPVVERLPLVSTTLAAGATSQKQIANFRVTAVGGQAELKKLTFNIAVTDATPSVPLEFNNFKLYRNGTLLGQNEYYIVARNGRATVIFAPPGQISTGGEKIVGPSTIYELKADIANAHAGSATDDDKIVVTLLGEFGLTHPFSGSLAPTPDGVVGVGLYDYNFIWSDGPIWTNGYQIPNLPSDPWILSK